MPDETPAIEGQRGDEARGDETTRGDETLSGATGRGAGVRDDAVGGRSSDDDAARLARLERGLEELSARLAAVERHLVAPHAQAAPRPFGQGTTTGPASATGGAGEAPSARAPVEEFPFGPRAHQAGRGAEGASAGENDEPPSGDGAARGGPGAAGVGAQTPTAARARVDFETLVGGSLAKWLGIVAGVVGVGFFLKYAFDSQWIGARGRVLIGASVGLGLVALAERLRARGYRSYPNVLTGGGVLILYLSAYAARVFYDLVGVAPAFALMAAVTTAAVLLSVRYDAIAIAVLALVGGFATPVMLSTGTDNQAGLFTYVAALDAGVLALAYFKRWRALNHLAFWLTALMFAGWLARWYESPKLWPTLLFLTLFFLMFSALAVIHNVLRARRAGWFDVSLLISNATLFFATAYGLLDWAGYENALGTFALLVSSFYVLLFYVARTRHREDRLLALAYVGAAATFFTLAVAIQLDQQWVTIGWAVEGLMLTWLGLRADERAARYASLAVFAVAALHWLSIDAAEFAFRAPDSFVPLVNRRAASCAVLVASLCGAAWLYRREGGGGRVGARERDALPALLALAASGLALIVLTADVNDYYLRAMRREADAAASEMIDNARQFALSAVWTLYGGALWAAGYFRRLRFLRLFRRLQFLRLAALALLALTAFKLLAADASYYDAAWHRPLFNHTFAAFALFVAAVGYVARTYARAAGVVEETERRTALQVLAVAGNLFAVVALSLEAAGYFDKQLDSRAGAPSEELRDLRLAAQLSLSLVWAVYGGAMLAYGHARANRPLRLMALLLLGATTAKVFLLDLSALDRFYRIVSFVALGAILLGVSFLYQQRRAPKEGAG